MNAPPPIRRRLSNMSPGKRAWTMREMTAEEAEILERDWPSWAHRGQIAASHEWRTWVIMAGRGFGKTRAGAEWVRGLIEPGLASAVSPPARIALVGATVDEVRRVMIEGPSGLLTVAQGLIAEWRPTLRRLRFVGGAEATLYSGASPEALRGPEHSHAWCDELAKWVRGPETWAMLQLGMRLGTWPQVVVTTTPRCGSALAAIIAAPGCVVSGGPTRANPHLPSAFVETVTGLYGGTRRGREELDGEMIADRAGALWTKATIEACRASSPLPLAGGEEPRSGEGVGLSLRAPDKPTPNTSRERDGNTPFLKTTWPIIPPPPALPTYRRTVIGVDPPAEAGTCGIILCALDGEGVGHVLGDHSLTDVSPSEWAARVAAVARLHPDTKVVAEVNQGGRMVQDILRAADPALQLKLVRAHHGKSARAEPVAMLFEQRRVRFHGKFPALEAELTGMIAGGGYEGPGRSPDRADAMVWAIAELMTGVKREPSVRGF